MNTPSNPRLLEWSVRRELWENRSLYLAPLAVATVFLFGFAISAFYLPHRIRGVAELDPAILTRVVGMPYSVCAGLIILTAFLVGVFYCLDALSSERRDRSILFWKSLPVSDRMTVLSKASIPLVVLPIFVFAVIVATHLIMVVLSSAILLLSGVGVGALWSRVPFLQIWVVLLYGLTVIALWHAPLYGWLLLVSAWSRRAAFLWAVLPFLAIAVFEGIAFRSTHFVSFIKERLVGWFPQAFVFQPRDGALNEPLKYLTPGTFLSTPGLWLGLAFAAALIAAAVRLRRYREPN